MAPTTTRIKVKKKMCNKCGFLFINKYCLKMSQSYGGKQRGITEDNNINIFSHVQ